MNLSGHPRARWRKVVWLHLGACSLLGMAVTVDIMMKRWAPAVAVGASLLANILVLRWAVIRWVHADEEAAREVARQLGERDD